LEVFENAPERNLRWIFNTRSHLIECVIARGRFEEARQLLEWSTHYISPTGSKRGHKIARLRRQGALALALKDHRQALAYYHEALEILESGPALESERVAEILYVLAVCQLRLGRRDDARHLLTQSLEQPLQQINAWGISRSALLLAELAKEDQDIVGSLAFARNAHDLAKQLHAIWRIEARDMITNLRLITTDNDIDHDMSR
jgi:tetratricopeptide (TPR) repeat protein